MELQRLNKMCVNETYSKACRGKHFSDMFPVCKWFKMICFITIDFQLYITIFHEDGPGKSAGTEI
jgi:hypothetical protein